MKTQEEQAAPQLVKMADPIAEGFQFAFGFWLFSLLAGFVIGVFWFALRFIQGD